ncbi:hypothetical protein KM043_015553 [Ampulex compressa]|nr:hypothetical protein KM043_015553 [Ampulex compressa]
MMNILVLGTNKGALQGKGSRIKSRLVQTALSASIDGITEPLHVDKVPRVIITSGSLNDQSGIVLNVNWLGLGGTSIGELPGNQVSTNVVERFYYTLRNTTLGNTLQESLDELIQYGQITPQLAIKVLLQFDKAINQALATRVKSRLTFKAGKLNTYRFCDNVWTFMLNDVEFREVQEVAIVDKVKIVACDGKTLDADAAAKR